MFGILASLLAYSGIEIQFLPAYSPELNPIELAFNFVKSHLRSHRDAAIPLWVDIVITFALMDYQMIHSFYNKALFLYSLSIHKHSI